MIYVSLVDGRSYVVAQLSFPDGDTAVVTQAGPQAMHLGLRPGMRIDRRRMSYANRLRLRYGVHQGAQLELPIESNQTHRVIVVPALRLRTTEPLAQRIFDAVTLTFSLLLAAFLGFRKPGVMVAALILFLGGGALSWPSFAILFSGLPDPLYAGACVVLAAVCDWFPVLALAALLCAFPAITLPPNTVLQYASSTASSSSGSWLRYAMCRLRIEPCTCCLRHYRRSSLLHLRLWLCAMQSHWTGRVSPSFLRPSSSAAPVMPEI
jgi:hypothetical protein